MPYLFFAVLFKFALADDLAAVGFWMAAWSLLPQLVVWARAVPTIRLLIDITRHFAALLAGDKQRVPASFIMTAEMLLLPGSAGLAKTPGAPVGIRCA